MIIVASILVLIVGLLMALLSANPKLQIIGYIMFGCGLLAGLVSKDLVALVMRQ